MAVANEDRGRVRRLAAIVQKASRSGVRALGRGELEDLPRLYRFASSLLARLETGGGDEKLLSELRPLLFRAHGLLHRPAGPATSGILAGTWRYLFVTIPRTVRAEKKLLLASFGLVYGLATVAYLLVADDLAMAYSLLDPRVVDAEIAQLRELDEGEAFRGNFTFGLGESARTSGWVMGNNMRVAVLFFAMALVPPIYFLVLVTNSLMLGTYTAVAAHWDQALSISSIVWCHGVLEIQAIVLSGTAGLVLMRAWVAPGPWSRTEAMRREGRRAVAVLAATFPMLFFAGLIEGFVSPHADVPARLVVSVGSGIALLAWILLPGRRPGVRET